MFGFDANKTIQAAAHLLKREPESRTNYMRLCKLLYLADRKSLELRRAPLIGDTPWAMERGPVPGATLDLIKGFDAESTRWSEFIAKLGYDVKLENDPGNCALTRAELKILDGISHEFRDMDEWDMVKWCHENITEFEKNDPAPRGELRVRIPLEDVLDAIGLSGERDAIVQKMNESRAFDRLFHAH